MEESIISRREKRSPPKDAGKTNDTLDGKGPSILRQLKRIPTDTLFPAMPAQNESKKVSVNTPSPLHYSDVDRGNRDVESDFGKFRKARQRDREKRSSGGLDSLRRVMSVDSGEPCDPFIRSSIKTIAVDSDMVVTPDIPFLLDQLKIFSESEKSYVHSLDRLIQVRDYFPIQIMIIP
jgi:hypothetical protein